jgi:hypothetical protein
MLPTEMLNLGAELRVNLADVLLATGERDAALKAISEAIDLYRRKRNRAAAIHARSVGE